MKDETTIWLKLANENLRSAELLLDGSLFNPFMSGYLSVCVRG
jgi:hypothetical protein